MSSILTNTSAMNALSTLRTLNSQIETTQMQVSTGKAINSAKDNSSMWSVANRMDSDANGFEAVSRSLSLGMSTVSVARKGAETIVNLLDQMKSQVIAGQDDNVDRDAVNVEIGHIRDQIRSVVETSQFNGVNLLNGSTGGTAILSSLKRTGDNISADNIWVPGQDLRGQARTINWAFSEVNEGTLNQHYNSFTSTVIGTGTMDFTINDDLGLIDGDTIKFNIGGTEVEYKFDGKHQWDTSRESIVAFGIKQAIEDAGITSVNVLIDAETPNKITLQGTNWWDSETITASVEGAGVGVLGDMNNINVLYDSWAADSLTMVDEMLNQARNVAANFGAVERRLDTQQDYITSLIDTMEVGVGNIVDADMEKVSATMQGLQVQQQLGVQALSIANRNPQNLLSLFR